MASPILVSATPDDVAALCRALQGFNRPHVGEVSVVPVNLATHAADGALLGGILAEVALEWLEIHVLWVEPQARGQGVGRALLGECERQAMVLGAHSARLDTFDWQAEAFYRERGYTCFARLEDYPAGHERVFMRKGLGGGGALRAVKVQSGPERENARQ